MSNNPVYDKNYGVSQTEIETWFDGEYWHAQVKDQWTWPTMQSRKSRQQAIAYMLEHIIWLLEIP